MDFDFIAEGLAKELISGSQICQCLKVAGVLQKLLTQREETVVILGKAADSLNGHYRRAAIAKSVGSVAGTGGKVVTSIGAATLVSAPISGGLGLIASAGCAVAGGATWAAGFAVTAGTYAVENTLCRKVISQANGTISRDQALVKELQEAWDMLTCMLVSVCDQFQQVISLEKIVSVVWVVYQRIRRYISSESVDWKGVVSKATGTPRAQVQNAKRRAVRVVKPYITKAFEVVAVNLVVLEIPGTLTIGLLAAVGALLVGLDIAVLLKNAAKLATHEEHPTAIEIKSIVENLKNEQVRLQSFYGTLQGRLAEQFQ